MKKCLKKASLHKVLGLLCAVVLFISALYIPVAFTANAATPMDVVADTTVTFGFEDSLTSSTHADNKAEFDANGIGLMGWGNSVQPADGDASNSVLLCNRSQTQTWATYGAYRLNKKVDGAYYVYNLEPSSKYFVTMRVRTLSSSVFTDDAKTPYECYVSLGYGTKFITNDTNYASNIDRTIVKIVSTLAGSGVYTLATNTTGGTTTLECGKDWQYVAYEFTTPADLGSFDHALAIFANTRTGFHTEIDDVAVTKLGEQTGIAAMVDEYSGKTEYALGTIGTQLTLPDISDRAQSDDHAFMGWYADEARSEKVENITFAAGVTTVYSAWKSPVSVTFIDEVNNTQSTVTGSAGEKFSYPADPVNPAGDSWFVGWFANKDYVEPHTSGTFGYTNLILYAGYKGEIPGLVQDFEEYPYCKKEVETVTDTATGVAYKKYKDNLIIGNTFTLDNSVTASADSKTSVKFVWDKTMAKDLSKGIGVDDPGSYNAATRYHEYDNYVWLGKGIEDKTPYIISFKYKVEKADAKVEFYALSAISNNGWGNFVRYPGGYSTLTAGDEWQEASFQFTTAFKSATSNYMYLGLHMEKNEDVILYIDDVEIKAVAQPYESLIVINNGYDSVPVNLKGVRDTAIEMPTLTHPSGAKFLGYYADEKCTEEFSLTTFPRNTVMVYAKWGAAPIKFNHLYTWNSDGTSFGKSTLSVPNEKGIGYDDDYALKFRFNAADKYSDTALMNTRFNQRDHGAVVAKNIEAGALYHVSYYVKNSTASNAAVTVTLGTGYAREIWVNGCWNPYDAFKISVAPGTDWKKVDIYFVPEVKVSGTMNGDALFLLFGAANGNADNYIEAYIDDVLVEKIDGDYIYFHGNASGASDTVVAGKAGESFTLPTLENGKSKLLGYFLDKGCTVPFTATTMPKGETHVYAKWELAPISFNGDYPFNTTDNLRFGKLFSIVNEKGIGSDDDYAIRWNFVGKEKYNDTQIWADRGSQFDSIFTISTGLEDGELYRITYDYMATSKTNVKISITPTSCGEANIWWNDVRHVYNEAAITIPAGGCGWQSAEVYISANVLKTSSLTGDALFLLLRTGAYNINNVADVRIDNIKVEKVSAPYVFFDAQNGQDFNVLRGAAGDKITLPANPKRFGHSFKGWYADRECTTKFTLDTFSIDTAVTAYAGWTPSSEVTYTFEKYDVYNGYAGKSFFLGDAVVDSKKAKSGSKSLHFGNRTEGNYNRGASYAAIAHGVESCVLEVGYTYIVSLNYCVNAAENGSLSLTFVAGPEGHFWAGQNNAVLVSPTHNITYGAIAGQTGKWLNKTFVVDTNIIKEKGYEGGTMPYTYLFLKVTGAENWDFCIDDVTVTRVPKGQSAVCIDNQGCSNIPTIILGKPGASFASKLPEKPELNDMYFKGYFTKDTQGAYSELTRENMVFTEEPITLFARFIPYQVTEGFEGDYVAKGESFANSYTTYDFDYEIYDSEAEGNSKDNVTGGRYALHRKGDSMYLENAIILTLGNQIAENERYTVSFKVKMGKHLHTDGAIKIVSGRSFRYAWTTTGDYYPVISIADLADGQWHEVTYTFNSVEAFACVQTPGYVELFMDDFKFSVAGKDAALSNPVPYTEYIPAKRDANGNLLEKAADAIDVTSIIDISLYIDNSRLIYVYIGAGGLVFVILALVTILLVVKHRKKKKAKA